MHFELIGQLQLVHYPFSLCCACYPVVPWTLHKLRMNAAVVAVLQPACVGAEWPVTNSLTGWRSLAHTLLNRPMQKPQAHSRHNLAVIIANKAALCWAHKQFTLWFKLSQYLTDKRSQSPSVQPKGKVSRTFRGRNKI